MRLTIAQIAQATGGAILGAPDPEVELTGITWDSREVRPDWLYVALPGERVDGHDFVEAAMAAGALCALVNHPVDVFCAQVVVADTAQALTDLAAFWRTQLQGTVIGLTGSTGKTTTKGLMADVLAAAGSVVATVANQNNELGVPRTLLAAQRDTEAIVVEMGMRGLGQIRELCSIAQPDWGLITNVGESHMELLGSRDNIARAKAELFEALPAGRGLAFVNARDDYASTVCALGTLDQRGIPRIFFDGEGEPDGGCAPIAAEHPVVWASALTFQDDGSPSFILNAARFDRCGRPGVDGSYPCTLTLKGAHNVINGCAAAALGIMAGLDLPTICAVLERSLPESGRQQLRRSFAGALIVDDAYNANPDSMKASLATFATFAVEGRRIAVLGDMGELGPIAQEAHERVGALAAASGLDRLICVGDLARHIAQGARSAGMPAEAIDSSDNLEEVLAELQGILDAKDAVLVKASHFMGFERIVEGLMD